MDTVKIDSKRVKMIAHRGVSGLERENTCPAFVAAGNRSYFGVETDVHKTKDGKFVIIHDETTKRVSLGKYDIDVEKNDYSAVRDIVLPDLDGSTDRQDIRIPLLSEYIKVCKKYNKKCALELKNRFEPEDIRDMIKEIKSFGYLYNMIFISFDPDNCKTLRWMLKNAQIQYLTGTPITDKDISMLEKHRLDLDIAYPLLTRDLVDNVHSFGQKVNCWTCDRKEDAEKLIEIGVDYITTNILE